LSRLLANLKRIVSRKRLQKAPSIAVNEILLKRAAESSADFIEPHLSTALLIRRADQIRDYAIRRVLPQGLILELGVYSGRSINQFAEILADAGDARTVYGFDAFEGLSEDWYGKSLAKKVAFNRKGKAPKVQPNVQLVIGWVEKTLAPFLQEHEGPIAFIHMDMDTYSPCKLALELCRDRFVSGTLILFDEHHGYPNWKNGEFKALNEVLGPDEYRYLAFSTQQGLIEVQAL
jgi:hypothetical protein